MSNTLDKSKKLWHNMSTTHIFCFDIKGGADDALQKKNR